MIAREWRCRCPFETCEAFMRYLHETGIKDTQATVGCMGVQVLRRKLEDCMEIVLVTYWESFLAITRYMGKDLDSAKLYPKDYEFGVIPDHEVAHYEVVDIIDNRFIPCEA